MGEIEVNQALTAYIEINETHAKCNSNEQWAQEWINLGSDGLKDVPCNTINYPLVIFYYNK